MIEMSAKAMTLTNLGVFTASNPTSESFIVTVTKAEHFGDGSSRKKKKTEFLTELMTATVERRRNKVEVETRGRCGSE